MNTSMPRSTARRIAQAIALSGAIVTSAAANLSAQNLQATAPPIQYRTLSSDELDSIVAPVALYADPLLAQVMLAATYPQQIDEAAKWVRANGTAAVDSQPWDVSVRAVAHYPAALNLLDSNLDWTAWLGAAYANQSTDLMDAVQHMRAAAQANGNLVTTPQQQVITDEGNISVTPAQAQDIYVPTYDPALVYDSSCLDVFCDPLVSFGVGYPIGPWLIYDWNWPARRIFYTGWVGGGWIARSRPFIGFSGMYVNERFRTVPFNHAALPFAAAAHQAFGRGTPVSTARIAAVARPAIARPYVSGSSVQRPFITRVPAPTADRSNPAPQRYSSPWGAYGGSRQATPSANARQSAPAYRAAAAPRASYQAPRPARQSYSAPQQRTAQVQRQAPAPRGGSSSASRAPSRGHGR